MFGILNNERDYYILSRDPIKLGQKGVKCLLFAEAGEAVIRQMFPVQCYIDHFIRLCPLFRGKDGKALITPKVIQNVLTAVNLLIDMKATKLADVDRYVIKTSLSEIARLARIKSPNEEQLRGLLGGLCIFNEVYVLIDDGMRHLIDVTGYQPLVDKNGKPTRRRWITFEVPSALVEKRPILVSKSIYGTLLSGAIGVAKSRFVNQLIGKTHKDADALQAEVFGYDAMLDEAKFIDPAVEGLERKKLEAERDTKVASTETNIRKHRTRDRVMLMSWFNEYESLGILTYKLKYSKADKKRIYEWKLLKEVPKIELEDENIDEQ